MLPKSLAWCYASCHLGQLLVFLNLGLCLGEDRACPKSFALRHSQEADLLKSLAQCELRGWSVRFLLSLLVKDVRGRK